MLGSVPHRKQTSTTLFLDKGSEAKIIDTGYHTSRHRTYLHPVLLTDGLIPYQESYMAAVFFVNNWIINYSSRKATGEYFINWC